MPRQPLLFGNPKEPVTRESLLSWLSSTGWVEGHTRKRTSPFDYAHLDDFIQSVWEEICKIPEAKLLEIYYKGKPKLVNYIKALIGHQVYSACSKTYKENKYHYKSEVYLTDDEWISLEEEGETNYAQQFPVINREKGLTRDQQVTIECDYSGIVRPEINLYEDDRNIENEQRQE